MTPIREELVRALLGNATDDEMRLHHERLGRDSAYRSDFERLAQLRDDLAGLPTPGLAPGLDIRVMAALRRADRPDAMVDLMARHFVRLALPAAAAAAILLGMLARGASSPAADAPVSLAAWYPLSSDPTADR